jgi:pimeloyl-ACP methyl ester carboxylesterase
VTGGSAQWWPGKSVDLASGAVYVRHVDPATTGLPPAVMVHGLGGSSTNWTGLMHELRDVLDQWAIDLPGYGESPPGRRHSVAAFAGVLTSYLDRFGRPVHLIGNSMGGLVSVLVAARRPDLVATLTLISPAMPNLRQPHAARGMALVAVPRLGERLLARANAAPVEQQVRQLAAILYGDPDSIGPDQLEVAEQERERRLGQQHADTVLLQSLRSIVRQYAIPRWRSAWASARLVSCPTLVMVGGRDALVHSSTAARWRRVMPRARVVHLPTTGHVAMMERPALVASMIREHIGNTS